MNKSVLTVSSLHIVLATACIGAEVVVSGKTQFSSVSSDLTSLSVPKGAMVYESQLPMPLISYSFDDSQAIGRNMGLLDRDLKIPAEGIAVKAGKFGNAIRFDGATRFQTKCQGLPSGNVPFSISVWLCPEAGGHNGGVCSWGQRAKGQSVGFGLQNSRCNFFFYGSDFEFDWPSDFAGVEWVHCLCVWDPTAATGHKRLVYLNGKLAAFDDPDFTPNLNLSPDNSLYFGNVLEMAGRNFKGKIDDFRIYSCALTSDQALVLASGMPKGENFIPKEASVSVRDTGVIVNDLARQSFTALTGNGTIETAHGAVSEFAIGSTANTELTLRGAGTVEKSGDGKLSVASVLSSHVTVKAGELEVAGADELARHVVAHWTFDSADPGLDKSGNGYRLVPSKGENSWSELTSANPDAVTFAGATDINTLVLNSFAATKFADSTRTDFPSGNEAFTVSVKVKADVDQKLQKCGIYSWGVAAPGQINALRTSGTDSSSTEFGYLHYNWGNDLPAYNSYYLNNAFVYNHVWDGNWHHVVVTYDPKLPRRRIYSDGMLLSEDAPSTLSVVLSDFAIGMSRGSGTNHNYWKGAIDDFMILNCALTAEQVSLMSTDELASTPKGMAEVCVEESGSLSVASEKIVSVSSVHAEGGVRVQGTLALGDTSSLNATGLSGEGVISVNKGSLTLKSDGDFQGTIEVSEAAQVLLQDGDMTIAHLSGDGAVVKKGSGTVSVTDARQMPAEVTVDGGKFAVCNIPELESQKVAHWSFAGNDPLADDDGKGYRFAPSSGSLEDFVSDIPGSVKFRGSSYLRLTDGDTEAFPKGNDAFTVAAWVIPEQITKMGANAYLGVWSWGTPRTQRAMNAFTFYNSITGQLSGAPGYQHYAWAADKSISTNPDDPVFSGDKSVWHQVAVTYEPATHTRSIYVDGFLRGSDTLTEDLNVAIGTINLGAALATGTDRPFKGYIGDFTVYRTALSAAEIFRNFRVGESGMGSLKMSVSVGENAEFAVESGSVAVKALECCGKVSVKKDAELEILPGGEAYLGSQEVSGTLRVCEGAKLTFGNGCSIQRLVLSENANMTIELDNVKEAGRVLAINSFVGDENSIKIEGTPKGWTHKIRRHEGGLFVTLLAPGFVLLFR